MLICLLFFSSLKTCIGFLSGRITIDRNVTKERNEIVIPNITLRCMSAHANKRSQALLTPNL